MESAKIAIEKLSHENNLLKQALEKEQKGKITKNEEVISLEEKLKKVEKEMKRCNDIRYNLSVDVQILQSNLQKLKQKLTESEKTCQEYISFFNKTFKAKDSEESF